jgi:glycerol-3-phosphate O-acyltransferase
MQAGSTDVVIVPCAIAYDLVLEDHVLARQRVKRQQRPFSREIAEMIRYAVGYRSRAFVTFGPPISTTGLDPHSRRDVLELAIRTRTEIGRLYKVLPTALVARAMRPSISRGDLIARVAALIDVLRARAANLDVHDAALAVDDGAALLAARGIIVVEPGRLRVRDRSVLRYYARTIEHLFKPSKDLTH